MEFEEFGIAKVENGFILRTDVTTKLYKKDDSEELLEDILGFAKEIPTLAELKK